LAQRRIGIALATGQAGTEYFADPEHRGGGNRLTSLHCDERELVTA
jgi:hypothetical protein